MMMSFPFPTKNVYVEIYSHDTILKIRKIYNKFNNMYLNNNPIKKSVRNVQHYFSIRCYMLILYQLHMWCRKPKNLLHAE